jgi:hypothetical protein
MKTSPTLSMRTTPVVSHRSGGPAGTEERIIPPVVGYVREDHRPLIEDLEAELDQVGGHLVDGFVLPAPQIPALTTFGFYRISR